MKSGFMCSYFLILFICCNAIFTGESELDIIKLCYESGYEIEQYEIETDDGYLLKIFRITHSRNRKTDKSKKYPVLLVHGLLGSADNFVLMGAEKSLAFILSDNGYDVWLCNFRGTWYSRKHTKLDPDKNASFWKFSWHELGIYDLPATIDHILAVTSSKQINYIGYSQGTTSFVVMCSEKPEYNEKIKLSIMLAPSVFSKYNQHTGLQLIAHLYSALLKLPDQLKFYEIEATFRNQLLYLLVKTLCVVGDQIRLNLCKQIVDTLTDESHLIENELYPRIVATVPAGCSVYQLLHYLQNRVRGTFQKYDWGREENLRKYKSETPPHYNLQNVTVPIVAFYGQSDTIVYYKDAELLLDYLPNILEFNKIPVDEWSHLDFMWAWNVVPKLYDDILRVLSAYGDL